MRAIATVVVSLAAAAAVPASAGGPAPGGEARIALVVGNEDYGGGGLQRLPNADNDLRLITSMLEMAGFDVISVPDADRAALSAAIELLTRRLKQAGPDAVGLFYYAGHGLQYKGTNYLLATDARLDDPTDIAPNGLDAVKVLWAMYDGGAATSILFLDACRQNRVSRSLVPAAKEGLSRLDTRGLLDKRGNVYIAYSTGFGEPASDGDERDGNSPFARILADHLLVPGLDIGEVISKVSAQMGDRFNQVPELAMRTRRDEKFFFVSGPQT